MGCASLRSTPSRLRPMGAKSPNIYRNHLQKCPSCAPAGPGVPPLCPALFHPASRARRGERRAPAGGPHIMLSLAPPSRTAPYHGPPDGPSRGAGPLLPPGPIAWLTPGLTCSLGRRARPYPPGLNRGNARRPGRNGPQHRPQGFHSPLSRACVPLGEALPLPRRVRRPAARQSRHFGRRPVGGRGLLPAVAGPPGRRGGGLHDRRRGLGRRGARRL